MSAIRLLIAQRVAQLVCLRIGTIFSESDALRRKNLLAERGTEGWCVALFHHCLDNLLTHVAHLIHGTHADGGTLTQCIICQRSSLCGHQFLRLHYL